MKKLFWKYLSAISVAGGIALLVLWIQNFGSMENLSHRLRALADAFTVSGVLFVMLSVLIWVASDGFFDGISYAGRQTARMLFPFLNIADEKYYDYKLRRAEHRIRGYSFICVTGLAFLVVAVALIVAFYAI